MILMGLLMLRASFSYFSGFLGFYLTVLGFKLMTEAVRRHLSGWLAEP
jgi:hypothetical protein